LRQAQQTAMFGSLLFHVDFISSYVCGLFCHVMQAAPTASAA
jgi:hypothetical protein